MYGSAAYAELAYAEIGGAGDEQLAASLFTNTSVFHAPAIGHVLTVALAENTSQFYSPTVSSGDTLFAPLLPNTSQFYTAHIGQTITVPHVDSATQFYAATVSMADVAQEVVVPTLLNGSAFYSITLTKRGGPITAAHAFAGNITQANSLTGTATITGDNLFAP